MPIEWGRFLGTSRDDRICELCFHNKIGDEYHYLIECSYFSSDFIWDFGKLPFFLHLGKYAIKIGKISTKIHEIGKIKAIFGLGMTPL